MYGKEEIDLTGATIARGENNTILITMAEGSTLENGVYELTFKLGSKSFKVDVTVAVEPEAPEQPENPDDNKPGQPDDGNDESPENDKDA